ncbi:MAG: hypothetical protein RLZZ298_1666 [Pseudomonadota bacterium]|jgi:hypothetical protein
MNYQNLSISALLIMNLACYAPGCLAMPPVVLTRDKTTAADLTGTTLLEKQFMQDCQLRLEGPPSNYQLVYSNGKIPVPKKAVKTMQDGYWARLAVKGETVGLRVHMLSLPYFRTPLLPSEIWGTDASPSKMTDQPSYSIVFEGNESVIEPKLRTLWSGGVMLNHKNHPNPNPGTLQYLSNSRIVAVGGFDGILPLQSPRTTTTVHYNCILQRPAAN